MTEEPELVDQVIGLARRILEKPGAWCQHDIAQDSRGISTAVSGREAVRFCAAGALARAARNLTPDFLTYQRLFLQAMERVSENGTILGRFNDAQESVEPVLALFDRALQNK